MKSLLVSACLLGIPCRYDGQSKPVKEVLELEKTYRLVPVCPEVLGGLPTPRIPCEIRNGRVINRDGADKTDAYRQGAQKALEAALQNGCRAAVLKEHSPSCGVGSIYDGSFTKSVISGDGVCAALLRENGIRLYGETQIKNLQQKGEML